MRMKIELEKLENTVVTEIVDVSDADGFAEACRELWLRLEQQCLAESKNVGELMEQAGESVAQELDGAEIRFSRANPGGGATH